MNYSRMISDLDRLLELCQVGMGESTEVIDLAESLRSASRIQAVIENETSRNLVKNGRKYGYCEICGGEM